ncbi:hypothetical protein MAR_019934, partial [Mya arenaria]
QTSTNGYERTAPDILKKLKEKVEHQKPSDVYAQMTDPSHNDYMDFPRGILQCQKVKAPQKAEKRKGRSNNKIADEWSVNNIPSSRENPLPSLICFKSFIFSNESVVGVDRTFSLGDVFVEIQQSDKKGTGEPSIFLGHLMLHWDGREQTYYRFFSILGVNLRDVELIMGTDDEKTMTNDQRN